VTILGYPGKIGKKIVKEIKEGKRKFTPDREKDLLTLVLGDDEHGGRTRGFGPSYPWWLEFAKDQETYRSRVTRVNSTNVLDKGLWIGGIGRRINSKVKSVKQGVYQK
jgi:hypothetical protein